MTKTKPQTPQEIYKARKQREEQERDAYLPPGLINSGNTCFMNSVLQGLIATPLLTELVEFDPSATYKQHSWASQIEGWRSPQLTNGHGLAGKDEKAWEAGMPLGDVFIAVMHKAWTIQEKKKRESMNARDLLTILGRKYDQYLDFGQQDAHEFLRHLLDAMSMEELDLIKRRNPPPTVKEANRQLKNDSNQPDASSSRSPTHSRNNSHHSNSESHPLSTNAPRAQTPGGENLLPLPDMIFGGKLTSILVCEKCKHVSQTYEDFNDLSLGIKAEDYAREKKRDRLKSFAKKLRALQPQGFSGAESDYERRPRPVSMPATTVKDESYHYVTNEDTMSTPVDGPSRQFASVNVSEAENSDVAESKAPSRGGSPKSHTPKELKDGVETKVEERKVGFIEQPQVEKKKEYDDGWSKLGRRLSLSVAFGRGRKDKKGHSKEKGKEVTKVTAQESRKRSEESTGSSQSTAGATSSTARTSVSDAGTSKPESLDDNKDRPLAGRFPSFNRDKSKERSRPTSLSPPSRTHSNTNSLNHYTENRIEKPTSLVKQPKIDRRESEYLRSILTDITPGSSNPLALLKNVSHNLGTTATSHGGSATVNQAAQQFWIKIGQIPGVEECLRMFTAVEVLDGENMVGCRRCWKMANGMYKRRKDCASDDEDSSSDSDDEVVDGRGSQRPTDTLEPKPILSTLGAKPSSAPTSPIIPALSEPLYYLPNMSDGMALASPSRVIGFGSTPNLKNLPPALAISNSEPRAYNGIIPTISTTAPESPAQLSSRSSRINPRRSQSDDGPSTLPKDSLKAPRPTHHRHHQHSHQRTDSSSTGSSLDSTDVSRSTTPSGYSSALASPATSQDHLAGALVSKSVAESRSQSAASTPPPSENGRERTKSKIQCKELRAKQVILRTCYKRYLIASPPPVLVIHLKRFQHLTKGQSILSFSSGLKKLDDYVAFPEHLDLTPFLAPKKEDFGLGRKGKGKERKEKEECMYRLYAVVVHIGNMLGGHYIAYTALPTTPPNTAGVVTPPPTASTTPDPHHKSKSPPRQWAYISDTVVRLASLEEVLKAKAYICMYERI